MTGSASDTLSGRHDTWKNSSYHVPEVLKSTDDGSRTRPCFATENSTCSQVKPLTYGSGQPSRP